MSRHEEATLIENRIRTAIERHTKALTLNLPPGLATPAKLARRGEAA
jgi:hypothetical protein